MERDKIPGRLVACCLSELHQHPSFARLGLSVPVSKLSALAQRGDLVFREPLTITQSGIIVDGYARFELARQQGRLTLCCIECELTEEEALRYLIRKESRSSGLNDFIRILLALELEPGLKARAESNQRFGGHNKGSSKLTEAESVDVRSEVAAAVGVSVGNVTKVKQLKATAHPVVLQALQTGEIRIHRAWLGSGLSLEDQQEALWRYQSQRGIRKTIRNLISRHPSKSSLSAPPEVGDLIKLLSAIQSRKIGSVRVVLIKSPGKTVFVTEELFRISEHRGG